MRSPFFWVSQEERGGSGSWLLTAPAPPFLPASLSCLCWRQFVLLKSQLWVQGHNRLSLYKKGHTHGSLVPLVHWGSNCHSSDTTQVSLP